METSFGAVDITRSSDFPTIDRNICSLRDTFERSLSKAKREFATSGVQNNHEGTKMSTDDLLRICKPVSVYLTRLPDSVLKKDVAQSAKKAPGKKKRRLFRWKHGSFVKETIRRRRNKMRVKRSQLAKMLQSQTVDNTNNVGEATVPDTISDCADFFGFESVTRDDHSPSKFEESAEKINKTQQIVERIEMSPPIAHEVIVSETHEYQLSITIETNVASHSPDQMSDSNVANECETPIVKSYDELRNTPLVATDEHFEHTPPSSPQRDSHTDRPISKQVAKRKNSSVSESGESNEQERTSERSKKRKFSSPLPYSESPTLSEQSNLSISNGNVASIQHEQALPKKFGKRGPRSVRRRRKSYETNSMSEVVVVVNRLDNSHSPLVQKWKNKVDFERLDDDAPRSSTSCHFESRSAQSTAECNIQNLSEESSDLPMISIEKDNEEILDSSTNGNGAEQRNTCPIPLANWPAPYDEETKISCDIVMCDSNEDDSEEDDDEIIEFLSTRRRVRPQIEYTSSENEFNDQEYRKKQSSRSSTKTSLVNRSESRSDHQKTKPSSRQGIQRPNTADDSSSESSCNDIEAKRTRSFHLEENRKTLSLPNTSITDWVSDWNSEDGSNHEDIRTAPLTRSRSRAAIDNSSYESTLNANGIPNNQSERRSGDRIPTYTCDSSHGTPTDEEINENESQAANSYTENVRDIVESDLSEENDVSLDSVSADCSEFMATDVTHIANGNHDENHMARKKLTAMKNAMVVLTRLEDLTIYSEGNGNCGSEVEFTAANGFGFSADYCHDSLKDDTDSNDDNDSHSDGIEPSGLSSDPLEIDHAPISGSHTSRALFPGETTHPSERTSERDTAIGTVTEEIHKNPGDIGLSQQSTESEYEMTLIVDERLSQEATESDVELSLFFDEYDKTSTETSTRNLGEGILTDSNGNNDRSQRTPATKSPEDLDEHCKRCNCEEYQRDNRRLKCQNISATHKCITCNSLFKNYGLLQQHRTSNAFCNAGFRCTVCQTNFMTLIELAKHRTTCDEKGLRNRSSVDQATNDETTPETQSSEATITELSRSKDKKQKQVGPKNLPKKFRSRPRCRTDNLTCNVCSTNFATKTDLSEHLYKHSSVELQEAFRIAKAKAMADSQLESAAKKNDTTLTKNSEQSVNRNGTNDNSESLTQKVTANEVQLMASNVNTIATTTVSKDSLNTTVANVCLCHRDNDHTPLDKTDLQIEMVLLCKYCQVLFRRRECLEVHYRTSIHCATDRTRERWPRLFCANCQLTLNTWGDMRHHLEVHARQNAERAIRFVCNICRVVFVGFGTLFYNHWISHSKDPMFVAGRYNFPKISVQLIDGTEKMPAGARSDENYIFIAEHVCATCKKPFSMRRDLEVHQQSETCNKKNANTEIAKDANTSRFFCDVCHLNFENKQTLNDHSKNGHGNRYTYGAVSTSANDDIFRCTVCSAVVSSVSAVEEHWRTDPLHNQTSGALESGGGTLFSITSLSGADNTEFVSVMSSVDGDKGLQNRSLDASTINVNRVTSTDKIRMIEGPPVITLEEEDADSENNGVLQVSAEPPIIRAISTDNQESLIPVSSITSIQGTRAFDVLEQPMLRDLLKKSPMVLSTSVEKQQAKLRALEDPFVKVLLSDTSGTNVSASLVINDQREKTKKSTNDSSTDSYQILLPNESRSGTITMVPSRKSPAIPAEGSTELSTSQLPSGEKDKTIIANRSEPTALLVGEPSSIIVTQKSVIENTTERSLTQAREVNNVGKENSYSRKLRVNKQIDLSLGALLKSRSTIPIIDIFDDFEDSEQGQPSTNVNTAVIQMPQSRIDSLDNNRLHTSLSRENKKSSANKSSTSIKIDSPRRHQVKGNVTTTHGGSSGLESNTGLNESVTSDRSKSHSAAIKASKMSFEEHRWNWINSSSVIINDCNSVATKKQGFLRVKDLSELQAVKTHSCSTCDAAFESQKSLMEHRRLHMAGGKILSKDVQYPTGMSAALVLPDSSERPKTPGKSSSSRHATRNTFTQSLGLELTGQTGPTYVSPQLVGVLSTTQGNETTSDQLASIAVNNESLGSWLPITSLNAPMPIAPRVDTTLASQDVNTSLSSNNQRLANNPSTGEMASIIPMSSTGINQIQDNFTTQQQQLVITSVASIALQDTSERLPENRTATMGYHVLPPMVVLPSAQATKHQTVVSSQRTTSNNYLPTSACPSLSPLSYQSDKQNKYLCNICHTFRCDTIEAFNSHVTKHYTGWKNSTVTQNVLQPTPVAMISATTVTVPTLSSLEITEQTTRQFLAKTTTTEANTTGNPLVFTNWTVKDTPQGPVLVTPVGNTASQSLTAFAANNNRSILRAAPSNSNVNVTNASNNGQIVFRCMICKSALYKNYPPLRNHVILVHGVTDFSLLGLENIAQKSYHCTQCPTTSALFDCEEKYRQHVDTIHTHACPSCRRVFGNFLTLRNHLEQCRLSSSNDRNSYGNNC